MTRTQAFVQHVSEAGLLKDIAVPVNTPGITPFILQGLQVIDEQKFAALGDDKVTSWFRSGELGWIYAHLASLAQVPALGRALRVASRSRLRSKSAWARTWLKKGVKKGGPKNDCYTKADREPYLKTNTGAPSRRAKNRI